MNVFNEINETFKLNILIIKIKSFNHKNNKLYYKLIPRTLLYIFLYHKNK